MDRNNAYVLFESRSVKTIGTEVNLSLISS